MSDNQPAYLTVGSHSILACRDSLAAAYCTRYLGWTPLAAGDAASERDYAVAVKPGALPRGITMIATQPHDIRVAEMDAVAMDDLHNFAVGQAWTDGAWDLQLSFVPALDGSALGLVTAVRDYSACDPLLKEMLVDAAGRGRIAHWMWRPMRAGPPMRRKAHAHKDITLLADGGRAGPPPANLKTPDWSWRKGREWTLQLGAACAEPAPAQAAPRRATGRQRACIVALRRKLGDGPSPLPARLTIREASMMIDVLQARL